MSDISAILDRFACFEHYDGAEARAAIEAAVAEPPEPLQARERDRLIAHLELCVDNPRLGDHVEISKATLRKAIDALSATATRGPLTEAELVAGFTAAKSSKDDFGDYFEAGVSFAERMHGITGAPDE